MELKLEQVTKDFGDIKAVKEISCTMSNGVYGLLGINGAGKTTLMRMMCTLIRPTRGRILFDGHDIYEMGGEYRALLGYLPQDFGFYPDFTVKDYLFYIASIKGLRPVTAKQRVPRILHEVGLERMQNKKMKKLSGGMKRRAGIAQAMLNEPKILVLDEPTAGLDPNERIRFRNLLGKISQDRLVLLSTHIVSDVEYIANKILLMKSGEIVRTGTPEEIISSIEERVYTCVVPRENAEEYIRKYKVANLKTLPDGIELRILSNEVPSENAQRVETTLEDVFLAYFGERTEEEDGIL